MSDNRIREGASAGPEDNAAITVKTEYRPHLLKVTHAMLLGGIAGVLGTIFISGVEYLFDYPLSFVTVAAMGVIGVGIGGLLWLWRDR